MNPSPSDVLTLCCVFNTGGHFDPREGNEAHFMGFGPSLVAHWDPPVLGCCLVMSTCKSVKVGSSSCEEAAFWRDAEGHQTHNLP